MTVRTPNLLVSFFCEKFDNDGPVLSVSQSLSTNFSL